MGAIGALETEPLEAATESDPRGIRFIKRSKRVNPRLSLILLDWSVRESFHVLHYLAEQDVPRDMFEVIVVEYYSRISEAVRRFDDQIDTWVTLGMPTECYYHKHLMYNAGFLLSQGEICVICDSDAMVKPRFIRAILEQFDSNPEIVLHLDQFRNFRRDLYPFNYPSFEEVMGYGCVNAAGGQTWGVARKHERLHSRNYGACMCARRTDLIAVGGADEHIDFLGHICGPYDLTFRLNNFGKRELWHESEFLYHTWHPGQDGQDNYLGPHDGWNMSTTALDALCTGRVRPLVENAAIRRLREDSNTPVEDLLEALIRPENHRRWARASVACGRLSREDVDVENAIQVEIDSGFVIFQDARGYYAHLTLDEHHGRTDVDRYSAYLQGTTLDEVRAQIRRTVPMNTLFAGKAAGLVMLILRPFFWIVATCVGLVYRVGRDIGNALVREAKTMTGIFLDVLGLSPGHRASCTNRWAKGRFLADALPTLSYLARAEPGTGQDFVLVVQTKADQAYAYLLLALGVVPRMKVLRIPDLERIASIVRNEKHSNPRCRIVMSKHLYIRSYYFMPPGPPGRDIIIF